MKHTSLTAFCASLLLVGCTSLSNVTPLPDEAAGADFSRLNLNWRSDEQAQIFYRYRVRDGKPVVCGYYVANTSGFTALATAQWIENAHLFVGDVRLVSISYFKPTMPRSPGDPASAACRSIDADAKALRGPIRLQGPAHVTVIS